MKYGDILGGFKKGVSENVDSKADWKGLAKELEKTRKALEKSSEIQKKLEQSNQAIIDENEKLAEELKSVAFNSSKGKEIRAKMAANDKEYKSNSSKLSSAITNTNAAKEEAAGITEQLSEAKGFKGLTKNLGATAAETQVLGASVGEFLGAIEAGPAALVAVAATVVAEVSKMTYEMMAEQNEAMVKLERATGGLASAATLGTNRFGKLEGSISTIGDVTRRANISLEEFSDAMTAFYTGGGGHTMGTSDIRQRKTAMMDLGIWGARIKKLYNADIIPAVRTLFQNWGQDGIMSLTDMMHDGVMQAKAEGLDPEQFAKNMNDVAKMSGKLTFKNGVKGMKDMAMYATKMGVGVDDIASGFSEMNSFTDIFENQARLAAMGFNNLGGAQGKVFGQRMQGDAQGAYMTELEGIVRDLQNQGGIDSKTGNLTERGQFMLGPNGLKYSQEQIQAVVNVTHGMKNLGLTLKQALKPMNELPDSVKKMLRANEEANKTLGEQWAQTTGEFKAAVTDRMALLFGPFLDKLASWLGKWNAESQSEDAIERAKKAGVSQDVIDQVKESSGTESKWGIGKAFKNGAINALLGPAIGTMFQDFNDPGVTGSPEEIAKFNEELNKATDEAEKAKIKQEMYNSTVADSVSAVNANNAATAENTELKSKENKTIKDQLTLERQKKAEFARANQGAILDAAMRDLVKYGSVASIKQMSVPGMDAQYKKSQEAEKAAAVAPIVNVTTNTKVDAFTGDAKTAVQKG